MRTIWSTLLVYGIAFAAVFGLQLLAVTRLLTWGTGALELERDALPARRVGVPASSLTLIAIALLAAGRPRSLRLRLLPSGVPAREIVVMVVGILALSQALESLVLLLDVGTGPALEWMSHTMASAPPLGLALAVVVVGLFAPVGEELFFRGYMLTRLRQVWSPGPAILVSAVAFGIIHGEWVHGLLAAGIGVYLGLVTQRSGSVVPAMICHVVNNTASVLLSAWLGSPQSPAPNSELCVTASPGRPAAPVLEPHREPRPHVPLEVARDVGIHDDAPALHQAPDRGILRSVVLEGRHAHPAVGQRGRGRELGRELRLEPGARARVDQDTRDARAHAHRQLLHVVRAAALSSAQLERAVDDGIPAGAG